ncbi:alpha/beta fold hydrolase [Nocardia sp. NPDC049737]|uniref:alpha/beta fold hydrolase n=1 Tax=Nocardia sp. NPDC049737 TaxID=3154358 RepID=UPI0034402040
MTITESDFSLLTGDEPIPVVTEVDGIPMSGLLAEARAPRAVLLALHGGATTSAYFDCPDHPRLSLLRLAAAAGYTVLALDRPGYGSSHTHADELADPQRRVDLMYAAAEQHLGSRPHGAGTFLLAHSAGSELALRMAADERGRELLGLELAGTGLEHQQEAYDILWGPDPQGRRRMRRDGVPGGVTELLWYPARLYPPELVGGARIGSYGPRYEGNSVEDWPQVTFPTLAAEVRIPVRFTVGDHERVWRNDPEALAEVAARFTAAPRVVLNIQPNSGHNLSMGHTAAAYHLGLLAFVEETAVSRNIGEFSSPAIQFNGATQEAN